MIVHFKKCSIAVLREMIESFYDKKIESDIWLDLSLNEKWTPAEINQILFRNFKDSETSLKEIVSLSRDDLYGFELKPE
jgi:hypothetical protein